MSRLRFTPPSSREELLEIIDQVLPGDPGDVAFLLELAIDHGPPERRAANQAVIVSLALIANSVVESVDESTAHAPMHPKHSRAPQHRLKGTSASTELSTTTQSGLPIGLPLEVLPSFLSFSPKKVDLERLDTGPDHERAALILIMNLIYQISRATGGRS